MLDLTDTIAMSIKGLVRHRLRTLLSTLGIIFGVAAVISMMSVGEGARRAAIEQIKLMGTNSVRVRELALAGEEQEKAELRYGRGLTNDDVSLLRNGIPGRSATVAPLKIVVTEIRHEGRRGVANIIGTSPEYADITDFRVQAGRFISLLDLTDNKTVCILGAEIKQELFGRAEAINAEVRIGDTWYTVVGVMEPKRMYKGTAPVLKLRNINRDVFIPVTTSLWRFPEIRDPLGINEIAVKVTDEKNLPDVVRLIEANLERKHRGVRDYEVIVPEELLAQARETQRLFNIVIGSIAGISLIVGGIGIMNIMLANVSERTREIGIRRAVGARRKDIMVQFLIETVLVCLAGGIAGIFLGYGMAKVISLYAKWETAFSLLSVFVAFGTSVTVGIVFGLFPAKSAAELDPVEALRL